MADLPGWTALASIGVAALAVIFTPITARLTYRWTKQSEDQRWNREREAEAARWEREERKRRVLRGEEAARDILLAVDEAAMLMMGNPAPEDSDLKPFYFRIRQQAAFITDDPTQARLLEVASNLYFHYQTRRAEPELNLWRIGSTCSEAAYGIVRAYLHGQPLPALPQFDRLAKVHREGGEMLSDEMGNEYDPLGEPSPPETAAPPV